MIASFPSEASKEKTWICFSCLCGLFSWACFLFLRPAGKISWAEPGEARRPGGKKLPAGAGPSGDNRDLPFAAPFSFCGAFVFFSGRRQVSSVERGHLFFSCLSGWFFWACFFFLRPAGKISWPEPGRQTNNQIYVPLPSFTTCIPSSPCRPTDRCGCLCVPPRFCKVMHEFP